MKVLFGIIHGNSAVFVAVVVAVVAMKHDVLWRDIHIDFTKNIVVGAIYNEVVVDDVARVIVVGCAVVAAIIVVAIITRTRSLVESWFLLNDIPIFHRIVPVAVIVVTASIRIEAQITPLLAEMNTELRVELVFFIADINKSYFLVVFQRNVRIVKHCLTQCGLLIFRKYLRFGDSRFNDISQDLNAEFVVVHNSSQSCQHRRVTLWLAALLE